MREGKVDYGCKSEAGEGLAHREEKPTERERSGGGSVSPTESTGRLLTSGSTDSAFNAIVAFFSELKGILEVNW